MPKLIIAIPFLFLVDFVDREQFMSKNQGIKILDYLHKNQANMVELLENLVKLESPSHLFETQQPVFNLLKKELIKNDYQVKIIPSRHSGGNLLAIPKNFTSQDKIQLLVGHSDTVWPLGTLEKMPLYHAHGKLYGPGTYDMKAGLMFMVFAIQALQANEIETEIAPVIFINSDEEIGSYDSRNHLIRLAKTAERAFILEPSLGHDGKLKTRRKGVGEFTIKIVGKASHAGLAPEKGLSAILELSFVVQKLFALNDPDKGITVNVGTIDGGIRPNVVAPESTAVVDVRILQLDDAERIETAIRNIQPTTPGIEIIVEGGLERPPMEKTPENEQLWQNAREIALNLGFELEEATAGGGSDGNLTNLHTPTLDGLGAVGDEAHAPGEFVYVERLVERAALLSNLLISGTQ
jgi:glutamate carboxypeptidase